MSEPTLGELWDGQKSYARPKFPADGEKFEVELLSLIKLNEVTGYRLTTIEGEFKRLTQAIITDMADVVVPKQKTMKLQYIARDWTVKGSQSKILILE